MRVLVTGSSGWLGRFVVPELRKAGHEVVGLDAVWGQHTDVVATVEDRPALERVFAERGIEAVVHAAALHKPDIARYPKHRFVDVNVTGTLNLLELAVAAGHHRFVFTSTTSLMVRADVRAGGSGRAYWLDEGFGPLKPRNIYGVTKLAAEDLCRLHHEEHGISTISLRTSRFFPEDDDTLVAPTGPNLKANEFLNRRLSVRDAARAHVAALEAAPSVRCETLIVSAPTPFQKEEAQELVVDAGAVVARHFPDAPALFSNRGWVLPEKIDRVYDSSRSAQVLELEYETTFASVLASLRDGLPLPFEHDPSYASPLAATKTT